MGKGKQTRKAEDAPAAAVGTAQCGERLEASHAQQERVLAALADSADVILTCDSFQEAARRIFDLCRNILGAQSGWVVLLSDDGTINDIAFPEAGAQPCIAGADLPAPIRALRKDVYASGKTVYENDLASSQWTPSASMPAEHVHVTNIMLAPLNLQGKTVGLMGLANKPTDFTDDDARLAEHFGRLITVALRHARDAEALKESESKHRAIFEGAAEGILVADVATERFLYANPAWYHMFGYEQGDLSDLNVEALHPRDALPHVLAEFAAQARGEKTLAPEIPCLHRNGTLLYADINTTPAFIGGSLCNVGLFTDVTARKAAQEHERMLEMQVREKQKLEALGTLSAGVAHEINNPINGIMNYAQLILDTFREGTDVTPYAHEIIHESERVATIVRNLLRFARNDHRRTGLVRIHEVVQEALSLLETLLTQEHVTLQLSIPESLPAISCQTQEIQQVLMNLIGNARDSLCEKYPGRHPDKIISLHACQFDKAGRRFARLTVEDHGIGIAPDVRDRIFDPFFTTKGRDKGTGMGLSISHGICRDHNGELSVESVPGQWTRFHIDLPIPQTTPS